MSSSVEQPRPRSGPTLSSRRAGHAVMSECLRIVRQHAAAPGGRADAVPEQARSWWIGAQGELEVGAELALLPDGWTVLHAVPIGPRGADIDHLVIGPGGVFVLNTKTHRRARVRVGEHVVWLDSGRAGRPYQRDVRNDALRVSAALASILGAREVVRPMLVFVDAARLEHVGPATVDACRPGDLVERLTSLPPVLEPSVVAALVARAEQPSTWNAPRSVVDEPDPTQDFLALPAPGTARLSVAARPRSRPSSTGVRGAPAVPKGGRTEAVLALTGAVAAAATVGLLVQALAWIAGH